jgi:hypothetical protein
VTPAAEVDRSPTATATGGTSTYNDVTINAEIHVEGEATRGRRDRRRCAARPRSRTGGGSRVTRSHIQNQDQ